MKSTFVRWGLLALVVGALAGCDGGSDGATGAAGAAGATGPAGSAGKDASTTVNAAALTADQWMALAPKIDPASISVNMTTGKPVVKFKVTDANGNPVVGMGAQSKASTALVPSNINIAFTLAKLVPAANGAPSKWVNYIVTKPGTVAAPATLATYPSADSQGTMVDNGDGSYQYTFWRDVTAIKAFLDSYVDQPTTATNSYNKADLGDVSYNASLTHRLGIIISGSQPGTGTATPTAVASSTTPVAVPLVKTFNIGYDFVPAGGAVASTRDIVMKDSCSECHDGKGIGHVSTNTQAPGNFIGRNDPRICVACHTDQTKYSFIEVTKTATGYSGDYKKVNGESAFDYPRMIHQTHMGSRLTKTGYNLNGHYNATTGANRGQLFNAVGYPQDQGNCVKCHDGSSNAAHKTTDGDNWKKVPSRLACGACHDGIDFATGSGKTVSGSSIGHIGGAKKDDQLCALCHDAASIPVYHTQLGTTTNSTTGVVTPFAFNNALPAGAMSLSYDVKSVSIDSARHPSITFAILKSGAPVNFGTYNASSNASLIPGTINGPTVRLTFAVDQDGITSPLDYNANISTALVGASGVWQAGTVANGTWTFTAAATATVPTQITWTMTRDASTGYYTVKASNYALPASVQMATAMVYGTVVETDLSAYPYLATDTTKPGLVIAPQIAKGYLTSTGFTARRQIVDNAKCNACHNQLGLRPNFHSGARNDGQACAFCHYANLASSGWTADSRTYIHGIHGASKRSTPFLWQAAQDYPNVIFPGVIRDCQQCHLPGTNDFSAAASAAAAASGKLLWPTVASGTSALTSTNPDTPTGVIYGAGFSYTATTGVTVAAAATTLVSSPIASACYSCHDTGVAKGHMEANGGTIARARSTVNIASDREQCLVCHASGKVADIKLMHQ